MIISYLKDTFGLTSKLWDIPAAITGFMALPTLAYWFLSSRTVQKGIERKFWDMFD
jgi:hypothetical protein